MTAVVDRTGPVGLERQRASRSLCLRSDRLLRAIIRASWKTRFGPSLTPQTLGPANPEALAAGRAERADGPRFFAHFRGTAGPASLRGRSVLDVGCGYGGRTIYYACECRAAEAVGIEPHPALIALAEQLARTEGVPNARFVLGRAEELPFESESFDAVVSFDVLEHVADPAKALAETARVLRPAGRARFVFPTYLGARASHLDYITRVPALHRVFDPETIVTTVNGLLEEAGDRLPTAAQPPPEMSSLGRLTLPALNGLTLRDARTLVPAAGLRTIREFLTPILDDRVPLRFVRPLGAVLRLWLAVAGGPELLVGSIALELERSA